MRFNTQEFEHPSSQRSMGIDTNSGSYSTRKKKNLAELDNFEIVQPKGTRFQSKDKQVQMSSKVIETWINETLQDA